MFKFLRSAVAKSETPRTIVNSAQKTLQETYVQEQQNLHITRALDFVNNYQRDRQAKLDLINEKIVSNGIDFQEFQLALAKEKSKNANVDSFSLEEIKKLIEKESTVQHDFSKFNRLSGFEEKRAGRQTSALDFNINNDVSPTATKKAAVKRQTQKITQSIFNQNKIVICDVKNQLLLSGILTDIYSHQLQFDIQTHPFKWQVKRTHEDFLMLREYLMKMYPQTLVPSLPYLNPKKTKITQKQLVHRCTYYQRFLTCIMNSDVLKSAEFLVEFLRETNVEMFHAKIVTSQYHKGPQRLKEMNTLNGGIELNDCKKSQRFFTKMSNYIRTYAEITTFVNKRVKNLKQKSHALAEEYFAVATEVKRFSTLLKHTEIPQINLLYDRLAQMLFKNGDFVLQSGEIVNNELSIWFKYHADETQAYRDAQLLVEQSKRKYDDKLRELTAKKKELFKGGDVNLWKVDEDDTETAFSQKNNFKKSSKFMLPNETSECQARKEEWEFFMNQCHKEMKRVGMMNYDMGREMLVNLGEMMLRIIYQMNTGWQEFLQYYNGMNTERKQSDVQFVEDKGLMEEGEEKVLSEEDESDDDDFIPGVLMSDESNLTNKRNDFRIQGEWLHF